MRWLWIVGCAGLGLSAACSESSKGGQQAEGAGTGGSVASGGSDATGGRETAHASGGKTSTGGGPGASSTGGVPSTGGESAAKSGGSANEASGGAPPSPMGGAAAGVAGAEHAGAAGAVPDSPDVTVRLERTHQSIAGFGVSNIFRHPMTEEDAEQLFDVEKGLGLSILRVLVLSSGYPALNTEDIEKAVAHGAKTFIGVAWSGPAECKTNGSENNGGYLEQSCYESWSDSLAAFPGRFKERTGAELYGLSPQNEPDFASCGTSPNIPPCSGNYPSMLYTPEQMVDFIKVLGPKIRALEPPVRLMGPETQEWNHLWTNRSAEGATDPLDGNYDYGHALFADPVAWGFLDLLATHQYSTQVAEPWPSDVPQTKPIWMTEIAAFEFWPEGELDASIRNGVVSAGWVHDALVNGDASAWLVYAHKSVRTNGNEGLLLADGTIAKRYYTLGNFSRHVRPGFQRVSVTGEVPEAALLSAYRGPDGQLAIVAINRGAASVSLPIFVSGGAVPAAVTPIVTSATDDLVEKPKISVRDGSFLAVLDAQSVTTFVSSSE